MLACLGLVRWTDTENEMQPSELNGIPRMHVHKVRELEEMVWYRENSLRFMKLTKPKAVVSIFIALFAWPAFAQAWCIYAKVELINK